MPLLDILQTISSDFGIACVSDLGQRAYVVDKINKAARELYRLPDLPVTDQECFVRVASDLEMSLPPFVGELRGVRSGCVDYCTPSWVLHTMVAKYTQQEWLNRWKNWRIKGYEAVATDYGANTAPGQISYQAPAADSELVVTIQGITQQSNNFVDSITMDSLTKSWTSSFLKITSISKNKITRYDVIITDGEGNEIAIIYADQFESRYMIVDISKFPIQQLGGCCQCDDGTYIMEILFKPRLKNLFFDTDFFPVDGYEDVLMLKTAQLLTEREEGKEQRAMLMNEKAKGMINDIAEDKQETVQRRVTYQRSPFFFRQMFAHWRRRY